LKGVSSIGNQTEKTPAPESLGKEENTLDSFKDYKNEASVSIADLEMTLEEVSGSGQAGGEASPEQHLPGYPVEDVLKAASGFSPTARERVSYGDQCLG
jgi:hypothetical protein